MDLFDSLFKESHFFHLVAVAKQLEAEKHDGVANHQLGQ